MPGTNCGAARPPCTWRCWRAELRLLLTRPLEDSRRLAESLERQGHSVLVEPLLSIEPLQPELDLAGVQALAVTSRHGLLADPRLFDLPLFAVGAATAERAVELGYRRVAQADGDAAALRALLAEKLDPGAGAVLHLASEEPSSLAPLVAAGFALRIARCYRARPAEAFSPACRDALAGNRLDGAAFLSPRTAATFVRLARESGVTQSCRGLTAFCLSAAVCGMLDSSAWRQVVVAARPRLEDLIAAIAQEQEERPRR